MAISQSGETADTLGAVKAARAKGAPVVGITNVVGSALSREATGVLYTHAGPEIGVASSKTFTATITACYLLALWLGRRRGFLPVEDGKKHVRGLLELPRLMEKTLELEPRVSELARDLARYKNFLFLGRGIQYPIALEGALKLKELSYIHAEGYAAGEMKHGPIALIDETMPVVALAPRDGSYDRIMGNHRGGAGAGRASHRVRPRGRPGAPGQVRRLRRGARRRRSACAHPDGDPASAPRVPRGGAARARRGPAAQPREVGHGRVGMKKRKVS